MTYIGKNVYFDVLDSIVQQKVQQPCPQFNKDEASRC